MKKPNLMPSFQLKIDPADYEPASISERESLEVMRESVSFWKEGINRFRRNKIAMTSLIVIIIFLICAFIVPYFYPYSYEHMDKKSGNLMPFKYSTYEQELRASGEKVFPHLLGTDQLGRDTMIRLFMGSRISLLVHVNDKITRFS